jgi:hypothetical protein
MERPAGAEVKPWGWNQPLWTQTYQRPDGTIAVRCRGVRAFIKAGGFSSIHKHEHQQNWFYVSRGRLMLKTYVLDDGQPRQLGVPQWLEPDDHPVSFKPGVLHQFVANDGDVEAVEIYMASTGADAVASDIIRFSENGPRSLGTLMGCPIVTSATVPNPHELPPLQPAAEEVKVFEIVQAANGRMVERWATPKLPGQFFIVPGSVDTP